MLIAIKKDDEVVIGQSICDGSVDMSEKDLALADNFPFWKVRGEKDCFIFADDINYPSDLLRYNDYVFKGITDGKSVIENVLPKMKDLLAKNNQVIKGKSWTGNLLIVKGNKVFRISNYFCVNEVDERVAVFCENVILGALDSVADLGPSERILSAVRLVNRMKNRQLFPITIFSTKTKRRKVYYK